jgi:hypothetical protein
MERDEIERQLTDAEDLLENRDDLTVFRVQKQATVHAGGTVNGEDSIDLAGG